MFSQYLIKYLISRFVISMLFWFILVCACMLSLLQSNLTLCDTMDCSPPVSSTPGILQEGYWNGFLWPPSDLFDTGIESASPTPPALVDRILATSTTWETLILIFSSVQSLSHVLHFATPWTAASQAFLSITNSRSLLKLMSIELVMPFNHLTLRRPLLLLPSIFPSIRVFSNESVLHIRWPKYWSFNFNMSPSSEYSGWISFKMDLLDLLAVQGTFLTP